MPYICDGIEFQTPGNTPKNNLFDPHEEIFGSIKIHPLPSPSNSGHSNSGSSNSNSIKELLHRKSSLISRIELHNEILEKMLIRLENIENKSSCCIIM